MKKVALIVAGGKGERMNADIPKQFLLLNNLPILMHTIKQFSHFEEIVLVLPKSQFDYWNGLCKNNNFNQIHILVEGGETRFHSVKNGLDKIDNTSVVAIHDGVRPLISTALINNLVGETKSGRGVIPIIPVKNSIRKIEGENSVHIDRSNLYKVQTPQCFLSADIKEAYTQDFSGTFTDDASVFEANGGKINTLLGEEKNLKITTQEDLNIAEIL
ncbi:2-C-methyl-D-erythritol 4-phosphate cytidylyltransferase [bacterium]|jgi:2-C-methyl-D-erythritol 4-phosphate cytidylyltransferase|nr:2-C-methyl-D-erythritol 4-phosphate cytidylyltransferase [Flavobacteriales bacterium]MBT6964763.1 2-C-methyl-D-erythritol 4-phosphate cytidylyltransferase [Flavobacteriales bacterium]MDB3870592.1 2-C-methyl-D-erythritol 4-phosphate cytidylyltransferase [bacterium]MDG2264015.1 2-C-methyl-D-erythritol 4-phosphate cytidylyltransferase [Flavobacteriales bacterium]